MVNYEKVIETLESLKIPYGDYGTDDERATNEDLDIAIRAIREKKAKECEQALDYFSIKDRTRRCNMKKVVKVFLGIAGAIGVAFGISKLVQKKKEAENPWQF